MIHLTDGDESKLPALVRFWGEKTAVWMDVWSQEREFSVGGDTGEEEADEPGEEEETQ